MKKSGKALIAVATAICMTGGLFGCSPASSKATEPTTVEEESSDPGAPSETDSPESPEASAAADSADGDFEKEVEKLKEAKDNIARDQLVLTKMDIKSERMSDSSFLFTITNTSNYSMRKVRFYFSPVVEGRVLLEGREIKDYDVIDDEWLLYNYSYLIGEFLAGSTVRFRVEFRRSPLDIDMSTIPEIITTDEPQIIHFELSDLMVTDEVYNTEYQNVELTNLTCSPNEGASYTLENISDRMLFPSVELLFLKDGKPVDLECHTDTLEPREKLDVKQKPPIEERPEYDEIKTFIVHE